MDSGRRKLCAVGWADLPAELLAIISGGLENPRELVRFRSVCQSWRFSTPPPTNKLSLLFPLLPPWIADIPPLFHSGADEVYDFLIKATCVYIVRSQDPDPPQAKAWMVSVQEPAPGKLVLRDALSYKELSGSRGDNDWIVATQTLIARSYAHHARCLNCNGVDSTMKVDVIPSSGADLFGVYSYFSRLYAFSLELSSGEFWVQRLNGPDVELTMHIFHDFVVFNGRIFAVDVESRIYRVEQTDLEVVEVNNSVRSLENALAKFVVSDGDLYLVWRSLERPSCQIYKLIVLVTDDLDGGVLTEQVEDLGDRVFFITQMWSFSISARLLPSPWQGNCILFSAHPPYSMCKCASEPREKDSNDNKHHHVVYDLGPQTFTRISSLQGYSDLFSPPASFK